MAWSLTISLAFGNMDSASTCSDGSCKEIDEAVHLQKVRRTSTNEDASGFRIKFGPEADENAVYLRRGTGYCDAKHMRATIVNRTTEDNLKRKCSKSDTCWGISYVPSAYPEGPGVLWNTGPVRATGSDKEGEWRGVMCYAKGHFVEGSLVQRTSTNEDASGFTIKLGPEADENAVYLRKGTGYCDAKDMSATIVNRTTEDNLKRKCSRSDTCWGISYVPAAYPEGPGVLWNAGPVRATGSDKEGEWRGVMCYAKGRFVEGFSGTYQDLGSGKCRLADGSDPEHKWFGSGDVKQMCTEDDQCKGYSASRYGGGLTWYGGPLQGGGSSWGGCHCNVK